MNYWAFMNYFSRVPGVVDGIEMSDVAALLAADATDVLCAAKAADAGFASKQPICFGVCNFHLHRKDAL